MLKDKKKIYNEIEYLRAFAIIIVVINHSSRFYSGNLSRFVVLLFEYSSPLFIFLAGQFCRKYNDKKTYIQNKFNRLLIPFIFFSILKILGGLTFFKEYSHSVSLLGLMFEAFIVGSLYWFCYCVSWQFVVAPFVWNNKKKQILVFFVGVLVCSFLKFSVPPLNYCYFQVYRALYHLPFFILGMLCQKYFFPLHNEITKKKVMLTIISILIIMYYIFVNWHINVYLIYLLNFAFRMACIYLSFFVVYVVNIKYLSNILITVGKYSYQIMFLDSALNVLFFRILMKFFNVNIMVLIFGIVLIILVSCLICTIVLKSKILSFCFGLKYVERNK